MIQRFVIPAILAVALVAGAWLLWHRAASLPAPAQPTPVPSATATPATVAAEPEPSAFRLAGTAVGEPVSFAAIEFPDGMSHLYRDDEVVPGLGRIVGIHPDHVMFRDDEGKSLRLFLQPAPSPTPERRLLNEPESTAATRPAASPARNGTLPGSSS